MTKELRHETLLGTGVVADANAAAEFRNDSAVTMSIIDIDYNHALRTGANDESVRVEITKSPASQFTTNNSPFFKYGQKIGIAAGTVGSGADDVAIQVHGGKSWGKGEVTLEPGESLFVNIDVVGGTALFDFQYEIGYEF